LPHSAESHTGPEQGPDKLFFSPLIHQLVSIYKICRVPGLFPRPHRILPLVGSFDCPPHFFCHGFDPTPANFLDVSHSPQQRFPPKWEACLALSVFPKSSPNTLVPIFWLRTCLPPSQVLSFSFFRLVIFIFLRSPVSWFFDLPSQFLFSGQEFLIRSLADEQSPVFLSCFKIQYLLAFARVSNGRQSANRTVDDFVQSCRFFPLSRQLSACFRQCTTTCCH